MTWSSRSTPETAFLRWPDYTPPHGLSLSHAQNPVIRNSLTHSQWTQKPPPPSPCLLAWKSRLGPLGASWGPNDNVAEAKAGRYPHALQVLGASCPAGCSSSLPRLGSRRVLPGARALRGPAAERPEPSEPLAKEHPHREPRPENCPDIFMLLESKQKCQCSASFLEVPLIPGVIFLNRLFLLFWTVLHLVSHKEQVSHGRNARPYPLSENLEVML